MSTRIERTEHALHDLNRRKFLVCEEIDAMEFQTLAGDLLDAPQGFFLAVDKAVNDYDLVAGLQEFDARVAADVAGTAGN